MSGGYNPWNLNGTSENNKKLVHWLGEIEYRYWLCQRFSGHFGIHALGTQYNIAKQELPLLFGKNSKEYRYEGYGYGAGFSYGYNFFLSKRWSLEANIGIGMHACTTTNNCEKCGEKVGTEKRNYFGPTKQNLAYILLKINTKA